MMCQTVKVDNLDALGLNITYLSDLTSPHTRDLLIDICVGCRH